MRSCSEGVALRVMATSALLLSLSCAQTPPPLTPAVVEGRHENRTPLDPRVRAAMWKVRGEDIVDGVGTTMMLRGISFGNEVDHHIPIPSGHHTGRDFTRVRGMGMNVVRFHLSPSTFEDEQNSDEYKGTGWAWVDQNVEWARENGVRLVLVLHSLGRPGPSAADNLWRDETTQRRFIELWQAIAERYRAEPTIVGFDLLSDPRPEESIEQWKDLAERTIAAVRAVDQHHVIFLGSGTLETSERRPRASEQERALPLSRDAAPPSQETLAEPAAVGETRGLFRVSDPNVVYAFRFYEPYSFTHQGIDEVEPAAVVSWYPDPQAVAVGSHALEVQARVESDALPPGDSDWTFLETKPFQVTDPALVVGKPFLVCDAGKGSARFDNLSLTKIPASSHPSGSGERSRRSGQGTADQREAETVFELDLDTRNGWTFWTENDEGIGRFDPRGQGDQTALSIVGTTGSAHLGSDPLRFFLEPGASYQLHAVALGHDLAEESRCLLRLEFSSAKLAELAMDRDFLRQELRALTQWGAREGVPVLLAEFGTNRNSFRSGRGGLSWVKDMLELVVEQQLHFSYDGYHDPLFGLFAGEGSLPTPEQLNRPLYELFVAQLEGTGAGVDLPEEAPENLPPEPRRDGPPTTETGAVEGEVYDLD